MEQRKGERQRDCASDNMADAGIGAFYRQPQITNAVERKLFLLPAFFSTSSSPALVVWSCKHNTSALYNSPHITEKADGAPPPFRPFLFNSPLEN